MQIFPLSDSILLFLSPTIVGTISDYLKLVIQALYTSLVHNCDNAMTRLPNDFFSSRQIESQIYKSPTSPYQYVSPIAYQLAAKFRLTPLDICQNIQVQIQSLEVNPTAEIEMVCWYNESGYIYFQFTPRSIAKWLNYIHNLPLELPSAGAKFLTASNIALYAHARCCAVLTLASTEKVVSMTNKWQITSSDWLNYDQSNQTICDRHHRQNHLTAEPKLIFEQPIEARLIHTFMGVLDAIYSVRGFSSINALQADRLAIDLAHSWLEFHRYCQIFGDIKRQNPRLAIARCGLTAISRRYLHVLLENYLGATAPTEL